MTPVYYGMSYGEYKKHTHRLHGTQTIGHSPDDPMTDESLIILKVTAEDHVHHYLETSLPDGMGRIHPSNDLVVKASEQHPVMKHRGYW